MMVFKYNIGLSRKCNIDAKPGDLLDRVFVLMSRGPMAFQACHFSHGKNCSIQLIRPRHCDFGQKNDLYGSACFSVQVGPCVIF